MADSHRISTIDVHVAGEPLRIITHGFPEPEGATILEKRRYCQTHLDHFRRALMWEPRGHPDMYGCLLVPPSNPEADFGVLFMHNEGYSTMCGHGVIGLVTVLIEQGLFQHADSEPIIRLETPSGLVTAIASVDKGRVRSVAFQNVPSFVVGLDEAVEVTGKGPVRYDLAFGGAFYGFCLAKELGIELVSDQAKKITELGITIKQAIMASRRIEHPLEPDLGFLYGIIFVDSPVNAQSLCRQVCIFADGALDRSPTGTGVSAHLAILAARDSITEQTPYIMESILGTTFTGKIFERINYHGVPAIVPEVSGQAFLTGKHEFVIDGEDPLQDGFKLGL
ncbi:MAG: proline racemase family protein [Nitrospirota bacterium]|nr:MAG: proline racemase family protein [Nitrospirota bacterium]